MPHLFAMVKTPPTSAVQVKDWDTRYAPIPQNHILFKKDYEDLELYGMFEPDFVLSQTKAGHIQIAYYWHQMYDLPIISLEHTLPSPKTPKSDLEKLRDHMSGHINVFITEYSRDRWLYDDTNSVVIPHCVDTDIFHSDGRDREQYILTVANDYIRRDWCLNYTQYKTVTQNLPTKPVGDTPGLSEAAGNLQALVTEYQKASIFLNTAHVSPIPTALLEAMASGCACVSCNTGAIPEYIIHGENGFLANNDKEMREYLQLLLADKTLCRKIGNAASKTIQEKCKVSTFLEQWDQIFWKAYEY